jgi:hypothetical protein
MRNYWEPDPRAVLPAHPSSAEEWETLRRSLNDIPKRLAAPLHGWIIKRHWRDELGVKRAWPCQIFAQAPYTTGLARHVVYALCDPRTREVFYVGVTGNWFKRLKQHCVTYIEDTTPGTPSYKPLAAKKQEIAAAGRYVVALVLHADESPAVANLYEGMILGTLRLDYPLLNTKIARWSATPLTGQVADDKATVAGLASKLQIATERAESLLDDNKALRAALRDIISGLDYDQFVEPALLANAKELLRATHYG